MEEVPDEHFSPALGAGPSVLPPMRRGRRRHNEDRKGAVHTNFIPMKKKGYRDVTSSTRDRKQMREIEDKITQYV